MLNHNKYQNKLGLLSFFLKVYLFRKGESWHFFMKNVKIDGKFCTNNGK